MSGETRHRIAAVAPRGAALATLASVVLTALVLFPLLSAFAQEDEPDYRPIGSTPAQAVKGAAGESPQQEVVIKRQALVLTDPRTYKVPMQLEAVRALELTSPVDGYVRTVAAKAGQPLKQQSEAVRLDETRAALLLRRAKANFQAAQAEKKLAQGQGGADQVALAEARLEAAQAELELAQMEADQLLIRAPFAGEILKVYVTEGQFVRAGERLATLIDASKLKVEVPVERSEARPGETIDIRVEEASASAKVETVQALDPRFDPLRELTISPASAVVTLDNPGGKFHAGQTVYSELIPLEPVVLMPAACVSNVPDGNRKVQVLRDNVVRNLLVRVLGKVGTDSVFVSGRFSEGDEVIVSSSLELADGTPLRSLAVASAAPPSKGAPRPAPAQSGAARKPGAAF